jgi:thiol:disulfide interchange protein DsbD
MKKRSHNWLKTIMSLVVGGWIMTAHADLFNVTDTNSPLPAANAFKFSATRTDHDIITHWDIAPGYYLYKDRFSFLLQNQPVKQINLPPALKHEDAVLGTFEAYADTVEIRLPVPLTERDKPIQLDVNYQGCSDNHFCYPPIHETVYVLPNTTTPIRGTVDSDQSVTTEPPSTETNVVTSTTPVPSLGTHSLWLNLLSFFGIGVLLAFTPCILPMIPILSGIIVGHNKISTRKALWVSSIYVLSMSLTYALVGVIAGFAGESLQTAMQSPWAIISVSVLFVALAMSLFGFYEIRMPDWIENRVFRLSNNQKSGSYLGAAIMGCLASLIISPCVTPPLIGAITYITQTGDSLTGGLALFVMSLGMGLPLVLVSVFGAHWLPRAGEWTVIVKAVFGVIMLMMTIYLLGRILPGRVTMVLWAALFIISSIYLGVLQPAMHGWGKFWKGLGLMFAICGTILIIGAAQGNSNPLQPLSHWGEAQASPAVSLAFKPVGDVSAVATALNQAKASNQITLLDFYAKWCLACDAMDYRTFSNPQVMRTLESMTLLRADITKNTPATKALKQQFNVIAPPMLIFFDKNGHEIPNSRIIGEVEPAVLLAHIAKLTP